MLGRQDRSGSVGYFFKGILKQYNRLKTESMKIRNNKTKSDSPLRPIFNPYQLTPKKATVNVVK